MEKSILASYVIDRTKHSSFNSKVTGFFLETLYPRNNQLAAMEEKQDDLMLGLQNK